MPFERRARRLFSTVEPCLPEFARIERGPLFAWVRRSCYEAVRAGGFLAESLPRGLAQVGGGRGGARYLELPGGVRAVLREYLRGGLPGRFLRDLHLGSARALAELALHEELARRGVPTLRVLAARSLRVYGVFFRHALLTEEVAARDLVAAAAEWPARRAALCAAAGRAVRALHEAGLDHADLHPGNLLVQWVGEA